MIIPTSEKRRSPRVPLNSAASLHTDHQRGILPANIVVANISETGVALEGPVELAIGDHYKMRLCLPNGSSINGRARIVWKSSAQPFSSYGAQLVAVNWWHRRRLRSYIQRYDAPVLPQREFSCTPYVGGLALSAGVVWYNLIASYGWAMVFLGGIGILLCYCIRRSMTKEDFGCVLACFLS